MTVEQLLAEILTELQTLNANQSTGQQSSCEIKFTAKGDAQPVVKVYANSEPPVEEAIDAYARTVVECERRQMEGWAQTLQSTRNEKYKAIYGSEKETGSVYDLPASHRA